ncbi:MAG: HDOD domain-containing protein [Leptospiraceae bacterium]|nr:HDOD domain-containing protein [Leptospiraceae bacterium]
MAEQVPLGVNIKTMESYRVLLVDDSKSDQMLLKQFLQADMFKIEATLSNGEEALVYLKDYSQNIDIICVDFNMPRLNGIETIKVLKVLYPKLISVMITSQPSKDIVNELFNLKVQSLIVKPISKAQVTEKLALALGRKDLLAKTIIAQSSKDTLDLNEIKIPHVPTVMMKVLKFDESTTAGSQELEQIISPDKAISLDILRISNSSFYGRSGTVKTLKDAITLLGVKSVKNLVLLQSKKQIAGNITNAVLKKHVMEMPILNSLVSFDLTTPLGLKSLRESVFTYSLFRKIGATILAVNFPKKYLEVVKLGEAGIKSFIEIEKEEFTLDSIEVGLKVFTQWKMPQEFMDIMRNQEFSIDEIEQVSDYDRLTRLGELLSLKMLGMLIQEKSLILIDKILDFYHAPHELKEAFGEDYYDNIKEHPYFM